ncbi:response regulator [soil metagenome]
MTRQEPQKAAASKPIILVVEDSADDWVLISRTLRQNMPQLQAVWLINADEVIPYLDNRSRHEEELPKLITLDLYLPSSSIYAPTAQVGIGVIQALKSHHLFRQIPLVTLSWSAHADDISEAMKYSTNSYLTKPNDQAGWLDVLTELRRFWAEPENKAESWTES